jgi:predicted metal-binding membrane protein
MWAVRDRKHDQKLFITLAGALFALAWLALWFWGQSPYGRFIMHDGEISHGMAHGGGYSIPIIVFVVSWTLMIVAMMLPTSLPLITLFRALVRDRKNHMHLVFLLIAGYLSMWILFGIAAHIGDWGVHQIAMENAWLHTNSWMIGAAILVTAGLYQFTSLKYHCLDKCRSPLSFIMERWQGGNEQKQAFRLGVDHGIFCIGCCWSLMLLMFVVSAGNIGWMLVLGTVMAVEKNMPWGRRLSAPLGVILLGLGLIMAVQGIPLLHWHT